MPDQIIEITQPGYRLTKSHGFLEVYDKKEKVGQVALDEIVSVIISVPGCMISTVAIDHLSQRNIPLVICGKNYMPTSITLSLDSYNQQFQIMQAQINLTEPRRKRAWQKIIQAKIHNQAAVLENTTKTASGRLMRLTDKVKSGDIDNCEAQASRIYWQSLFGKEFRRDPDIPGLNSALNYAYAVVRSCVARGISSAGLHPSFSLHHINSRNPFNLVDDLMESFRPSVDYLVWINRENDFKDLTPDIKGILTSILNHKLQIAGHISPLSLAAVKMSKSFADYCIGTEEELDLPVLLPI